MKSDLSLVMKVTNGIKKKQSNFNPITDYASIFLSLFESNLMDWNCTNLALQILPNFLDQVGLNFYHEVLAYKPNIDWQEFKEKFTKYF